MVNKAGIILLDQSGENVFVVVQRLFPYPSAQLSNLIRKYAPKYFEIYNRLQNSTQRNNFMGYLFYLIWANSDYYYFHTDEMVNRIGELKYSELIPKIGLPKGSIEGGESLLNAAKREFTEETKINIDRIAIDTGRVKRINNILFFVYRLKPNRQKVTRQIPKPNRLPLLRNPNDFNVPITSLRSPNGTLSFNSSFEIYGYFWMPLGNYQNKLPDYLLNAPFKKYLRELPNQLGQTEANEFYNNFIRVSPYKFNKVELASWLKANLKELNDKFE